MKLTVCLKGGLGNNMFQITSTFDLATRLGAEWSWTTSPHSPEWITSRYRNTIFKNLPHETYPSLKTPVVQEKIFGQKIDLSHVGPREHVVLDIYGQWPSEWTVAKPDIARLFKLPVPSVVPGPGTMGVHYRGGDYLHYPSLHDLCRLDYYEQVVKVEGYDKILVTDDLPAARKIAGLNMSCFRGLNEVDDMAFLSRCDAAYIGNSTFAWWGAYLGRTKSVYAPAKWLGKDHPAHATFTLTLPEWEVIPNE